LDVEELGSVYESLLDFSPKIEQYDGIYQFKLVTGSDRKTTGSYYTPPELVAQLIKTALEPVIEDRLKEAEEQYKSDLEEICFADRNNNSQRMNSSNSSLKRTSAISQEIDFLDSDRNSVNSNSQRMNSLSENTSLLKKTSAISQEIDFLALQEQALLNITVCDPACGSGHFLLAAARRIGKELAKVRTGETQPGVEPIRTAIRDVIQHCIYGVDLNPLAVDLCKLALWIEGFNRGKPLSFLDHRIKCGNSLVGVLDLDCLNDGIPDNAFKPVTGDNKDVAKEVKQDNKTQRQNSNQFIIPFDNLEEQRSHYGKTQSAIAQLPEDKTGDIKQKQQQYRDTRKENSDNPWWRDTSACNLWTAAFFTPLTQQKLQLLPTSSALFQLLRESGKNLEINLRTGAVLGVSPISDPFKNQADSPNLLKQTDEQIGSLEETSAIRQGIHSLAVEAANKLAKEKLTILFNKRSNKKSWTTTNLPKSFLTTKPKIKLHKTKLPKPFYKLNQFQLLTPKVIILLLSKN
jgi:hypothetical protein